LKEKARERIGTDLATMSKRRDSVSTSREILAALTQKNIAGI
jgi:hypothetical protein